MKRNPRDIHGDGHGFVDVPQVSQKRGVAKSTPVTPTYTPGIYRVEVFDFEGRRLASHHCDGTYDQRGDAVRAVVAACDDKSVGYCEFVNQSTPREYSFNYDLSAIPVSPLIKFLGLYKFEGVEEVQIIWRAEKPISGLRYLTEHKSESPHYVQQPLAWARLPRS